MAEQVEPQAERRSHHVAEMPEPTRQSARAWTGYRYPRREPAHEFDFGGEEWGVR